MPKTWLVKEEPERYPFGEFVREGRAVWDGVRNPLAQRYLRAMRRGDRVLYYHTGRERAVVGVARAASDPYPDARDPRYAVVDLEPVAPLPRPVPLAELKTDPAFRDSPLLRVPRLSVMPVTAAQWKRIEVLARGPEAPRRGRGRSRA